MLVTKPLLVSTDFPSMEKNTTEVNQHQELFGYQHSLKYNLLF